VNRIAKGFPVAIRDIASDALRRAGCPILGHTCSIERANGRPLFGAGRPHGLLAPAPKDACGVFLDDPDLIPVDELRSKACHAPS